MRYVSVDTRPLAPLRPLRAGPQAVRTLGPQPDPPRPWGSKYSPELAALILMRLSLGESLASICRADPAMPTEKTVWNWRRAHPGFAAAYAEVVGGLRKQAVAAKAKAEHARCRRRSRTGRRAWNRGQPAYDLKRTWDWITWRLAMGETLQAICAAPGLPAVATVYYWLRRYPAFARAYQHARELGCMMVIDAAMEGAPPLGSHAAAMRALRRCERAGLRRASRIAPRRFDVYVPGPPWDEGG